MIVLAIDTCEARGSVAVLNDDAVLRVEAHTSAEEYSSWLLAAVDLALQFAKSNLDEVEVFAAASGPGSFTGVRIGLTTVKAWSEVFEKPIVALSRLEAVAAQSELNDSLRGVVHRRPARPDIRCPIPESPKRISAGRTGDGCDARSFHGLGRRASRRKRSYLDFDRPSHGCKPIRMATPSRARRENPPRAMHPGAVYWKNGIPASIEGGRGRRPVCRRELCPAVLC